MKAQAQAMGTDEPVAHNQRAVSKGGLVIDEQSVGIDSGTATTLDAIGKALGVEIRIDNSLTTGNGMWSPGRGKNGLNLISIKSDTNTALSFLYGHEITHEIKRATQGNDKLWQGFVQAVRKAIGEAEFDARVKEAQERWNEEIKKYNEDQKAKGSTDFASLLDVRLSTLPTSREDRLKVLSRLRRYGATSTSLQQPRSVRSARLWLRQSVSARKRNCAGNRRQGSVPQRNTTSLSMMHAREWAMILTHSQSWKTATESLRP